MTDDLEELLDEHDAPKSNKMSTTQIAVIIIVALLIVSIPIMLLVGIVMWQLGIFNMGGVTVTATGFGKLKPMLAGTGYSSDGTFTSIITNGVGTNINVSVDGITVVDDSGGRCGPATIQGSSYIMAGSNFRFISNGCPRLTPDDPYDVRVTIPYTVTIGGVSTNHEETGTVRGPAE